MKKISVIILCHNNYGISYCIKAVLSQMKSDDEIIVVNDHSEEIFLKKEFAEFSQNKQVHLYSVTAKKGNRSFNRNFGVGKSHNDILLFLDGDMVISQGTLQAFRNAHENKEYVAFLGNAHGMRFSMEHMAFHIGNNNYCQLLQSEEGIKQLIDNPALQDWRIKNFQYPEFEPYYWIYYYTCICSADRSIFLSINGFDEALVTWGSEDIDLGYRLSNYGKIGYAANAHAVHYPHKRNLWNEQLFDRDNIRYLLDKHRVWPFEMLLSFEFSGEMYELIQQIYEDILSWNLPRLNPQPVENSIWVNTPSVLHISDTIVFYNNALEKSSLSLLGISIPCCDLRFKIAYLSANIFSYPMEMTSRIIQECMRISQEVIIMPSSVNKRYYWEKSYLLQAKELYRTYYVASDTMEYEFVPIENGCYKVNSPQILSFFSASRSHCPIQISAESRKLWYNSLYHGNDQFILVNLLQRDTDEICKKLECALNITFVQKYYFSSDNEDDFSLTKDLPFGLRTSKHSLLFVINSFEQFEEKSVREWKKIRQMPDYILNLDGSISQLT